MIPMTLLAERKKLCIVMSSREVLRTGPCIRKHDEKTLELDIELFKDDMTSASDQCMFVKRLIGERACW